MKGRLVASNNFLATRIFCLCQERGIGVAHDVEYLGIDFRNQTKRLGSWEEKEKKTEMFAETWFCQQDKRIQKRLT